MSRLVFFLVVTSLYWALVRADYTIDDSDYSVLKFSENPAGPVWGPFGSDTGEVLQLRLPNGTMQTVDATQCYDGTFTYAACSASNSCAVQFSFTGSGITVYVLRAGSQGMSASLSIDAGAPTTATLGAPPPPQHYISHATLFDVQNIPSGTHSAVITVLDWNGGFSGMMLDYIAVNQAQVSGPSSSASPSPSPSPSLSPSPTSLSSPSSPSAQTTQQPSLTGTQTDSAGSITSASILSFFSSQLSGATPLPSSTAIRGGTGSATSSASKKTNVAAVVGGVVGGALGLLALLGLALFCVRRRRYQRLQTANGRRSPLLSPQPDARFMDVGDIGADPFASSSALAIARPSVTRTSHPLLSWTDSEAGSAPNFVGRDTSDPILSGNYSHTRVASSGNDSATSSAPVMLSIATAGATAALVSHPNEKSGSALSSTPQQNQTASPDVPGTRPNAALTDEQADFVNSLFNNNVPAAVVARVLERMLANPHGASSTGYNDPELRSHLSPGNLAALPRAQGLAGGVTWQPTMNDIGDGETAMGTGTAPPSYDYVQAQ